MGSLTRVPGPMMATPLGWCSTAWWNISSGEKPKVDRAAKAMKVAPDSSSTALMICTQVVAVMPPKIT